MNEYVAEIASLRSQLDTAIAEREYYRGLCGQDEAKRGRVAQVFKARPAEAALMCIMSSGRVLNKYVLFDAMPHKFEGANPKIVDVYICRLRRKLGQDQIKTVWGSGYVMEKASADQIRAVMECSNV